MRKSKKFAAALLSGAVAFGMMSVGATGAFAAVDSDTHYIPDEGVEANRVYFLMPDSWNNEAFNSDAGAYWWTGTGAGESVDGSSQGVAWPGYRMFEADKTNGVYYIDIPTDVAQVVFNNFIDGGELIKDDDGNIIGYKNGAGQYKAAQQTVDVSGFDGYLADDDEVFCSIDEDFWNEVEAALNGDDKTYLGDFADNFYEDDEYGLTLKYDNMIYVVDTSKPASENVISGKASYGGQFYFYYGMNEETGKLECGSLPNYDLAKDAGVLYEISGGAITPVAATGDIILGDVTGDGAVDISDATEIQKYVAAIVTEFTDEQTVAADVNGDGVVDISDATEIQKLVAQIITEFPTA